MLEATMHSSYLKAAKLKAWLSRPDCPPIIRECKSLFDKLFHHRNEPEDAIQDAVQDKSGNLAVNVEQPVSFLLADANAIQRARVEYDGVVYARSSSHLGNSYIHFFPNGAKNLDPIPASIKHIFVRSGNTSLAVIRHLPASAPDPFRYYCDLPIKLWSSKLAEDMEVIELDWVAGHVACWEWSSEHCVFLDLSRD
jgi:hypothetical protein